MVGSPKAMLSTTLAVLRPTPGQGLQGLAVARHLGAVLVDQDLAGAMTFLALALNRPMVLMCSRTPSSPSASMASGVFATVKSFAVALLTLTSVACAESTTAISSSNAF